MRDILKIVAFTGIASLVACGGGGGGGYSAPTGGGNNGGNNQNNALLPQQASIGGSTAWVAPTSGLTLYTFDADTTLNVSSCTGACASNWPPAMVAAGAVAQGNFTIISRSNPSGQQWAYLGKPLYTFTGDTATGQDNGNGINAFGGLWHTARPNLAGGGSGGATPPPGCVGYYC
ncbi:MAG: hypothetical protein JOZ38_10525 [Candidatus Eremiobacteraeota bacterium]|nr:hypothetical protein [Candidatus Eremiobacteraeota bacterium]